jgi:S1-C subfamily serine protease
MSIPAGQTPSPSAPLTPDPDGRSGSGGRPVRSFAVLALASVLGAGVALGGAAALGAFNDQQVVATTVTQQAQATESLARGEGLSVGEIYRRAGSGVVQITTSTSSGSGLGSGFVIDDQGHVVTNYHVIDGAGTIRVSFSNKDTLQAELVGSDPSSDLAVLKVDAGAGALTPLALANSDSVRVGDPVVAIGNPFGLERTVTSGIVSALQRAVTAPNGYTIEEVIQTDAPINQGNSGGPLFDASGKVIGVNSQIETANGSSGNVGIGFAVPSNTVQTVVSQLIAKGKVTRAYLGVTLAEVSDAQTQALGVQRAGLLVQTVQPDSPAAGAGLRGGSESKVVAGESYMLGGDLIVAVDGQEVATVAELRSSLADHAPGDVVTLDIARDGATKAVRVTLGQQPASLTG